MTTTDQTCTCGHGAASAHDTDSSVPAFTACVATGCDCRAFTQAPAPLGALAGREQRRRTTANILARLVRAKHIQEDEATLLRTLVAAEQADGDQAREQLAAAERDHNTRRVDLTQALGERMDLPWPVLLAAVRKQREARSGTRNASDVLVQHDVTRKALCDALDQGYHLNWQQLVDTAQRSHDANAAWQAEAEQHRKALAAALYCPEDIQWGRLIRAAEQTAAGRRTWRDKAHEMEADAVQARRGEAEAVRARKAAERRATESRTYAERADRGGERLAELLGQAEARVRAVERSAADARIRSGRSIAEARRNRDAWRNARKRAARLSAEVTRRAPLTGEYAARARTAEIGLTELRKQLDLAEISARANKTAITEITERAEQAEATITRVRAVLRPRDEDDVTEWQRGHRACSIVALNALDHEQPATEPERCGQYGGHGEYCDYPREPGSEQCAFHAAEARTHDAEPDDPCAHGCRQAADDLTRLGQEIDAEAEQPAEPEPDAPCFHPSWETEPTVGARKCTDCGEWLDPEPPAEPVGAALWATIRDHAARDHQFWTDLNRDWERQYRQGVRL